MSGLFALAVELLRFLIPPGESQAFLAAAAGERQRSAAEPGSAHAADQPSSGVRHASSSSLTFVMQVHGWLLVAVDCLEAVPGPTLLCSR